MEYSMYYNKRAALMRRASENLALAGMVISGPSTKSLIKEMLDEIYEDVSNTYDSQIGSPDVSYYNKELKEFLALQKITLQQELYNWHNQMVKSIYGSQPEVPFKNYRMWVGDSETGHVQHLKARPKRAHRR
jgi:hypothetical protein